MKKFLRKGLALAVSLTMLLSAHVVYAEDTATQPSEPKNIKVTGELINTPVKGPYLESNEKGVITSEFDESKLGKININYENYNLIYEQVEAGINGYENAQILMKTQENTFVDVSKSDILDKLGDIQPDKKGILAVLYLNPLKAGDYSGRFIATCVYSNVAYLELPSFTVDEADVPTTPVRTKPIVLTSQHNVKVEIPPSIKSIINPSFYTFPFGFDTFDFYPGFNEATKDYNIIKKYLFRLHDNIHDKDFKPITKITDGKVKVTIPINGDKNTKYTALGYTDKGDIIAIDCTYDNNAITFETDIISPYFIATSSVTKANNTATTKVPVPQTSEESPIALVISLSLAGIILLFIRKKYINNCNS